MLSRKKPAVPFSEGVSRISENVRFGLPDLLGRTVEEEIEIAVSRD